MADNKNSANILVCESQETLYAKAVKKMTASRLIVQYAFKIENYLTAAAMFDEVGDYQDAKQLAEKCRELAEQTRSEQKKDLYQKALELKGRAEGESDYEKAIAVFGELGAYEEAQKEKADCEKRKADCGRRRKTRQLIIIAVLLLCLALVGAGYSIGFFRYAMGVCYAGMEYYEKAEKIFEDLDGLLDSQERALDCAKQALLRKEEEETQALRKAKAGNSVIFGSDKWKVLERQEDRLLLILEQVDADGRFYQVPYQEAPQAVNWAESSLREWLNGELLETIFDEEDRGALLPVNEGETKTEGQAAGNADETGGDCVSILTVKQAGEYQKILHSLTGRDYWLQDQGQEETAAAFVSASGDVMMEGYSAQAQLSVRPVILVDCTKLEAENKEEEE